MLIAKRSKKGFYLGGLLVLGIFASGGGCATTNEGGAATGQEGALSGPKPTRDCEQYLALLSDEHKQPLLAQYGAGGSCWVGSKEQAAQCDDTCSQGVNQLIRSNLNKNNG